MGLFDNDTLYAESYYYYQDANEQQSEPGARKREFDSFIAVINWDYLALDHSCKNIACIWLTNDRECNIPASL